MTPFYNSFAILVSALIRTTRFRAKDMNCELNKTFPTPHIEVFRCRIVQHYCELASETGVNESETCYDSRSCKRGTNMERSNHIISQFNPFKGCCKHASTWRNGNVRASTQVITPPIQAASLEWVQNERPFVDPPMNINVR